MKHFDDGLCREVLVGLDGALCLRPIKSGRTRCLWHEEQEKGSALAAENEARFCHCGRRARSGKECGECRSARALRKPKRLNSAASHEKKIRKAYYERTGEKR